MIDVTNRRSQMVLYSDIAKPIGHTVRIVLAEKDINVDIKFIDEGERPEELNELNPYNSILTLVDRDLVLYDAQIMMEYLDERFPHPSLMPVDPVSRADNRQLRYRIIRDLYTIIEELDSENEVVLANAKKTFRDHLTTLSPLFEQKPYFMSEEYTLIDCCMASLLWRLTLYGIKLPISAKPLQLYADRLFERPAFQASLSEVEKEFAMAI